MTKFNNTKERKKFLSSIKVEKEKLVRSNKEMKEKVKNKNLEEKIEEEFMDDEVAL